MYGYGYNYGRKFGISQGAALAAAYKLRVEADGGTYENNSCLTAFINSLNPYSGNLLLGLYPDAAAAFSLRKLNPEYTGSAIRVRRSSDNSEQDIGFSGTGLDTSALETFCGVGDGFVVTWYDQSGNSNDATQTTAASQPKIVSSGTTITDNGKPAVDFDGTDDELVTTATLLSNISAFNAFYVANLVSGSFCRLVGQETPGTGNRFFNFGLDETETYARSIIDYSLKSSDLTTSTSIANTQHLFSQQLNSGTAAIYLDSNLNVSDSSVGNIKTNTEVLYIGNNYNGSILNINAKAQEIIIYNTDQSSNRTGIESNINNEYGIY